MGIIRWIFECIPVVAVVAIITWSYYTYIGIFCEKIISDDNAKKVTYITFYHFFLLMVLWSYLRVMCTGIAIVPYEFKVPRDLFDIIRDLDDYAAKNRYLLGFCYKRDLVVVTRNEYGLIRYCTRCKHVKPDRAHHCSTCGTCVLKMDHHCPWVHNCIGFSNYKAFITLLFYGTIYCAFYAGTTLETVINFLYKPSRHFDEIEILIGFLMSAGIGTLVFSLFCYHMSLIAKNETTLETLRAPIFREENENLTFNVGTCPNFGEVFGDNCVMWLVPEGGSKGDGIHFPVRMIF